MPPRPVLGVVAALALAGAACGVQGQDKPVGIDRSRVPFELAGTTPTTEPPGRTPVAVYFLRGDQLAKYQGATSGPPTALGVVEALIAGPDAAGRAAGLSSAFPQGTVVRSVGVTNGVAAVDLETSLADAPRRDQVSALAQLVFSLTELSGVDQVRLLLDGEPVEVLRADGTVTRQALDREDFRELAAIP